MPTHPTLSTTASARALGSWPLKSTPSYSELMKRASAIFSAEEVQRLAQEALKLDSRSPDSGRHPPRLAGKAQQDRHLPESSENQTVEPPVRWHHHKTRHQPDREGVRPPQTSGHQQHEHDQQHRRHQRHEQHRHRRREQQPQSQQPQQQKTPQQQPQKKHLQHGQQQQQQNVFEQSRARMDQVNHNDCSVPFTEALKSPERSSQKQSRNLTAAAQGEAEQDGNTRRRHVRKGARNVAQAAEGLDGVPAQQAAHQQKSRKKHRTCKVTDSCSDSRARSLAPLKRKKSTKLSEPQPQRRKITATEDSVAKTRQTDCVHRVAYKSSEDVV